MFKWFPTFLLLLVLLPVSGHAGQANIDGGLELNLSEAVWPDAVRDLQGTTQGVPEKTDIFFDKKKMMTTPHIAVVSSPNDESKLGTLPKWAMNYQLPGVIKDVTKGSGKNFVVDGEPKRATVRVGDIQVERLDVTYRSDDSDKVRKDITVLLFTDPAKKSRYAAIVFLTSAGADNADALNPAVDAVVKGISW